MDENKIIQDNIGLVYESLKRMNFKPRTKEDFEDAVQIGLMGLLYAIRKYEKGKSKPSTYYMMAIMSKIRNLYITNSAKKRDGFEISLDEKVAEDLTLGETLISPINIEQEIINKISLEEIVDIIKRYPILENAQMVLEYYGIGCPQLNNLELSKKYGISFQAINRKILRCLEWVKGEINHTNKKKDKPKIKSIEELLKEML